MGGPWDPSVKEEVASESSSFGCGLWFVAIIYFPYVHWDQCGPGVLYNCIRFRGYEPLRIHH